MLKKVKNQKGFTLVELIAVLAILAILALVAIPRVANYSNDAKAARAKSNLVMLKNAIERYNLEHDTALSESAKLKDVSGSLTTKSNDGKGPYIASIPSEWAETTIDTIMQTDPDKVTGIGNNGAATTTP